MHLTATYGVNNSLVTVSQCLARVLADSCSHKHTYRDMHAYSVINEMSSGKGEKKLTAALLLCSRMIAETLSFYKEGGSGVRERAHA